MITPTFIGPRCAATRPSVLLGHRMIPRLAVALRRSRPRDVVGAHGDEGRVRDPSALIRRTGARPGQVDQARRVSAPVRDVLSPAASVQLYSTACGALSWLLIRASLDWRGSG